MECVEFKPSNDPAKPFFKGTAVVIDKSCQREFSHIRFYIRPDGQKWINLMSGRYTNELGEEKWCECTRLIDWRANRAWKEAVLAAILKKIELDEKKSHKPDDSTVKMSQPPIEDDDLPF